MSIFEAIGIAFVIFSTAATAVALAWCSVRWLRQLLDDAKRGVVERQRDVARAAKVREAIEERQ